MATPPPSTAASRGEGSDGSRGPDPGNGGHGIDRRRIEATGRDVVAGGSRVGQALGLQPLQSAGERADQRSGQRCQEQHEEHEQRNG
jgi:hypothetical protein